MPSAKRQITTSAKLKNTYKSKELGGFGGFQWNSSGIQWNSMEFSGIWWNSMAFHAYFIP